MAATGSPNITKNTHYVTWTYGDGEEYRVEGDFISCCKLYDRLRENSNIDCCTGQIKR